MSEGRQDEGLKITFRGVRGSYPVPGEGTKIFGGNTACIEITAGRRRLIFDAGTGICSIGSGTVPGKGGGDIDSDNSPGQQKGQAEGEQEVEGKRLYDIFLSHTHWDHIQGFPFFQPAYREGNLINIYGFRGIKGILERQMGEPYFPVEMGEMGAELNFYEIDDKTTIRMKNPPEERNPGAEISVSSHPIAHSPQSLCYRIEYQGRSSVYLGDYEHTLEKADDCDLAAFIRETDLLIYDAHFTNREYHGLDGRTPRRGWGHSTWQEGVKLAGKVGAGRLVFFHHAPFRRDEELFQIEARARELFPNCLSAKEGMEIIL